MRLEEVAGFDCRRWKLDALLLIVVIGAQRQVGPVTGSFLTNVVVSVVRTCTLSQSCYVMVFFAVQVKSSLAGHRTASPSPEW